MIFFLKDTNVDANFKKINCYYLILPLILIIITTICLIVACKENSFSCSYPKMQKSIFIFTNKFLNKYPNFENNITYLGDALVVLPLLSYFFIKASKIWQALITSSLLALIVSAVLKRLISMPRPAAVYEANCFHIIGKKVSGATSLPSGHSITIFFVITIVLFAFLPQKKITKIIWSLFILTIGLIVASSRVGVGAHYPLDVYFGSIIGFSIAILGIIISAKTNWLSWINNPKYLPFFMIAFLSWLIVLITKFFQQNLVIYLFPILTLIFALYQMTREYVQRKN